MTQIDASEAKECNYYLQIAVQLCRWYAADQQKVWTLFNFCCEQVQFWHKSIYNRNNSALKRIFNKIIVIMRTTNLYFKNSQDKEMIFLYFHEVQFCGSQSVEVTFIHRQQLKTRIVRRRGRSLWKTFRKLSLMFLRHFKSTPKRHYYSKLVS